MKILSLVVIALLIAFAGCAETKETTAPPVTTAPPPVSGEDVFNSKCAGCHAADDKRLSDFPLLPDVTWTDALNRMKSNYSVNLSDEEFGAVESYLIEKYAPPVL